MASHKNRLHRLFGIGLPEWKEAAIQPEDTAELQLIGVGLCRTGTSSLKAALEILGFNPCHHMVVSPRKSINIGHSTDHDYGEIGLCAGPQTRLGIHRPSAPTRPSPRPPSIYCSHWRRPQGLDARLQSHRGWSHRGRLRPRIGLHLPQRKMPPLRPRFRRDLVQVIQEYNRRPVWELLAHFFLPRDDVPRGFPVELAAPVRCSGRQVGAGIQRPIAEDAFGSQCDG